MFQGVGRQEIALAFRPDFISSLYNNHSVTVELSLASVILYDGYVSHVPH